MKFIDYTVRDVWYRETHLLQLWSYQLPERKKEEQLLKLIPVRKKTSPNYIHSGLVNPGWSVNSIFIQINKSLGKCRV